MDFHALSRRELQALCKRNTIRANMSNAAMADALQALPSVYGLDEIRRTALMPMAAMVSEEEVIIVEERTDGNPIPRGGRARSKARMAAAEKREQDVRDQSTLQGSQGAVAREAVAPVEVEEVVGEEQGHGCPLLRGGRRRAKTRNAAEHKEAVLAPDTLQGSQRTAAGEDMAPVEAEEVATGKRRTRRSARSKGKVSLDQKEEVSAAVWKKQKVVSGNSCDDPKECELVEVVDEEDIKGQNVTRRSEANKTEEEVPAPAILRRSQRTASVEVEEVAMAKKRTRRSRRSKVAVAALREQTDSSDLAIESTGKSCDCTKEDGVVAMVDEEATKQFEGGNVRHKIEEVLAPTSLQPSQKTVAPEAAMAVEGEEVATTKRGRRRGRPKVTAAAQNGKKADSSDAVDIGSLVVVSNQSCDDPKEKQLVTVMEEQVTKPKEGIVEEHEQMNATDKASSVVKVEDSPTVSIQSKVEAADIPDKTAGANEETIKEDGFIVTVTGGVDQSSLLVNTLDRFAKPPKHEFSVKGKKKEGECWWMLM